MRKPVPQETATKKTKRITVTLSARFSKALREYRADEFKHERGVRTDTPNYQGIIENALWTFWKKWAELPTGTDAKALRTVGRRP
jgi:integrase